MGTKEVAPIFLGHLADSAKVKEQAIAIARMNSAITHDYAITHQDSATAGEETASASEELHDQVQEMRVSAHELLAMVGSNRGRCKV
jgi:hypothetical protein